MTTTLYLVRHAHAHWTPDDDRPLSDAGAEAAQRLGSLVSERPITAIYSSPSRRALDTVGPLAARLGQQIAVDPDFREREMPIAQVSPQEFERLAEESWRFPDQARAATESNLAARERGSRALMSVVARHRGQHVVVSTHGTLMALMINALDSSRGLEFWRQLSFPDVYALELGPDGVVAITRLWTE